MKNILIISFLITFGFKQYEISVVKPIITSVIFLTKTNQIFFQEKQLIGRWYYLSKENDKKTKLENLADKKYLKLRKNKSYNSNIFEKNQSGKWKFYKESQILELEYQNTKTEWKLVNLNEFGMVLTNLGTNEKWIFALKE